MCVRELLRETIPFSCVRSQSADTTWTIRLTTGMTWVIVSHVNDEHYGDCILNLHGTSLRMLALSIHAAHGLAYKKLYQSPSYDAARAIVKMRPNIT